MQIYYRNIVAILEHLGDNILFIRTLRKQTQSELATLFGVKPGTPSTWEKRGTIPSPDILQKISEWAGYSIDELFNKQLRKTRINGINPDSKEVEFTLAPADAELEALRQQVNDLREALKTKDELIEALKALIAKGKEKR